MSATLFGMPLVVFLCVVQWRLQDGRQFKTDWPAAVWSDLHALTGGSPPLP